MTLVSWRDEYRVGVPTVDAEHRYLFSLINAFHDGYLSGQPPRELLRVFTCLVAYAEEHFQHEEALMRRAGYPRLAEHKLQHDRLYATVYELNEQLARGEASVDRQTMRLLKHWLVDHILQQDLAVGDFLRIAPVRGTDRRTPPVPRAPSADQPDAAAAKPE